jgi:hypothetical protein
MQMKYYYQNMYLSYVTVTYFSYTTASPSSCEWRVYCTILDTMYELAYSA